MKKLLIGIAVLALAVFSQAQRGQGMGMMMGQGGGNPLMLLAREDVQEDLALTSEQKEKLLEFTGQEAMRNRFMKFMQDSGMSFEDMRSEEGRKKLAPMMEKMQADMKKEIEAVMTPAQVKRLGEINVQFNGNRSVMQKDIAKALAITEAQQTKIDALNKGVGEARRALMEKMRNQELSMEEFQEKNKKNDDILNTEIGKVLTDAQKAKLSEMGGKKFVRKDS
ncbi:MAG: hypothetical protein LW628_09060 [Fimbriimonadaceae bacterium]|jgi:hypothetical protein|nr:hypothetical protein [Fimbriimonadaceae bacterium]MCE2767047.1 hypothetical protein [Fimbriimonadaceae bacterium]